MILPHNLIRKFNWNSVIKMTVKNVIKKRNPVYRNLVINSSVVSKK